MPGRSPSRSSLMPAASTTTAFTLELTTPTEGADHLLHARRRRSPRRRGPRADGDQVHRADHDLPNDVRACGGHQGRLDVLGDGDLHLHLPGRRHPSTCVAGGVSHNWGATRVDYEMDPASSTIPTYASTIKDDLKTIPSVCVVLGNDDFFGAQKASTPTPRPMASSGRERPPSSGSTRSKGDNFQVNAGLRVHGSQYGRTASVAKHSLRIVFRNEYGPSPAGVPALRGQ